MRNLKSAAVANPGSWAGWAVLAACLHLGHFGVAHARGANVEQKDVELLRLAATEHRANLQRLRTWRARVVISAHGGEPKVHTVDSEKAIEFAYDQDRGIWWRWEQASRSSDRATKIRAGFRGVVSKADGATYFRRDLAAPKGDAPTVIVFPEDGKPMEPRGISPENFDPLHFFRETGEDVAGRFLFFCETYKGGNWPTTGKIRREGDLVALSLGNTTGTVANRYTADLARGGNLVRYESMENGDVQRGKNLYEYTYKQFDGVWVPNHIKEQGMTLDGEVFYEKETEWLENVVNEPLPAELFTIAAVGASDGDFVDDQRAMVKYVYAGDAPVASGRWRLKWILLGATVVLAATAGGVFWRVARKRRAGFGANMDNSAG